MPSLSRNDRLFLFGTGSVLLVLTYLAHAPGLSGGFLLDDAPNLSTLGAYGPVDNLLTLLYYLTSGIADPTGRPVALASFLLDARDWPAQAYPFKRTNVLLHLCNGVLLFAVILQLERRNNTGQPSPATGWAALLAATLWMVHPLFVSTTLYVVQRHAMLPLTFTLLALLCWDRVWQHHLKLRHLRGWIWAGLMASAMALAALSKPNGFLAPLLVLCAAIWLYAPSSPRHLPQPRRAIRWIGALLLALPSLTVLIAIAATTPSDLDFSGTRDFTLGERLLSQPRALIDYLFHLAIPRMGGGGVFVEDFAKSSGWLNPPETLAAFLAVLSLIGVAFATRQRWPIASFALMFFFLGHLMESGPIMLELYFEHRNYLPAAFLFWPLARWLVRGQSLPRLRLTLAVVLPAVLLALTALRASDWGDPEKLAALSAVHHPGSARAQLAAAAGSTVYEGAARLRSASPRGGDATAVVLSLVGMECRSGRLSSETIARVDESLTAEIRWHAGVIAWLRDATVLASQGGCSGLNLDTIQRWLQIAVANRYATSSETRQHNLLHLKGVLSLYRGEPEAALAEFDRALALQPTPDTALTQAALLGSTGFPDVGLCHLDHYLSRATAPSGKIRSMQQFHTYLLWRTGYYQREIEHLKAQLQNDARQSGRDDSACA